MVSLLPATDPGAFCIMGGNSQLAPRLLQLVNATVHCQAAVAAVQRLPDGRFELELKPAGAAAAAADEATGDSSGEQQPQRHGPFDTVIIASPLEASGLAFVGIHLPIIPARKYQQVVTTLVKGSVRPSYFGLSSMIYCKSASACLPASGRQACNALHVSACLSPVCNSIRQQAMTASQGPPMNCQALCVYLCTHPLPARLQHK